MKTTKPRTINHAEQRAAYGVVQRSTPNYVAGPVAKPTPPAPPTSAAISHTIDAAPHATQHVEVTTSQVDRGLGFLLTFSPLFVLFGVATVAVCVIGAGVPTWSVAAIGIFLVSTLAAWLIGLGYMLEYSPEGVTLFEAGEKWALLREEQRLRWRAWLLQMGLNDDE